MLSKWIFFCLFLLLFPTYGFSDETKAISFNTADIETFIKMEDGIISNQLATEIVTWRNKNGRFKTPKDLLNVPGFKTELFDALIPQQVEDDVVYIPDTPVTLPSY